MERPNTTRAPLLTLAILGALLLCGLYLRFYHLGQPSFWVDELNHVYAGMALSQGEAPEFPSGVANERALLYSRTVGWAFALFGVNEFAARFSSAVFGLLSIVLVFWVGKRWLGTRVGLLAAFFLTFAHPAIGWSRTCRMYALFQLLFLLGVYWFYKGFEGERTSADPSKGESLWGKIKNYLAAQGMHPGWLAAAGLVLLISFQMHQLTGLFGATVAVYCAASLGGAALRQGWRAALTSKYAVVLGLMGLGGAIGFLAFNLGDFIRYALEFHPDWARYDRAQDTHFYYWWLTAGDQFPLAALFLIGALQAVLRLHRPALFSLIAFVVPLFFHSFVFSYKVPNYVFNVYPFFVLLIAYGLNNLYESELPRVRAIWERFDLRRWVSPQHVRGLVLVVFVAWIPLTVWFRIAVKIPLIGSAGKNGVVTHYDWRGAAQFVAGERTEGDAVLTTLPLTVLYYLGDVDYNLNLAHLDESLRWETPAANGRTHEFYTGAPSVMSVTDLQEVMQMYRRGWVIVDRYRLAREQYVPKDLAQYIQENLTEVWTDPKKTMSVFFWSS